jgi:hypothetical protein
MFIKTENFSSKWYAGVCYAFLCVDKQAPSEFDPILIGLYASYSHAPEVAAEILLKSL